MGNWEQGMGDCEVEIGNIEGRRKERWGFARWSVTERGEACVTLEPEMASFKVEWSRRNGYRTKQRQLELGPNNENR